jgi:heme a synthase
MSLDEFKFIFFWEYIHRVAARLIGLVFLIPFLFFLVRGYFTRPLLRWTLVLFALGGMQGLMGWLMVASGLVDRPSVSHYRLAAHLSLALVIFGCCYWLARQMDVRSAKAAPARSAGPGAGAGSVYLLGALLSLQIFWGALVAGLKAGRIFNTFPLMGDGLIPPGAWYMRPWVLNLLENPATVQWTHRVLGTALAAAAVWVWLRARRDVDARVRHLAAVFAGLIAVQYLLGVLTLLMRVPVSLGVLHQSVAVVILGVWIAWLHHVRTRPHAEVAVPDPRYASRVAS